MSNTGSSSTQTSQRQVAVSCCCGGVPTSRAPSVVEPKQQQQQQQQRQRSVYFDTNQGYIQESELFFFDAFEETPQDDEYPIITTNYIPKRPERLSLMEPETMLSSSSTSQQQQQETQELAEAITMSPPAPELHSSTTITTTTAATTTTSITTSNRRLVKFLSARRRPTLVAQQDLQQPRVAVRQTGFPGQLTPHELEQCQTFYREIHARKGTLRDIVYALSEVEDEPYALCRFLRATKFQAQTMLERLERDKAHWETAAEHNFYPNLATAMQASLGLVLQFYPSLYHGNAKNGCPVLYFKAGQIQPEGLLCLSTMEGAQRFFWNQFYHSFRRRLQAAQAKHADFCRCETINVMDLQGLGSSQVTSEALSVMKMVAKIGDFFPETLHCMLILNAPSWFAVTWRLIRSFIDPRTASKIEVYAYQSSGQKRLLELIDSTEIPREFGGTGPAWDDLIRQQEDSQARRKAVLVYLKKRQRQRLDALLTVQPHETLTVEIHTRSLSGVSVTVQVGRNRQSLVSDFQAQRAEHINEVFSPENPPLAYTTRVFSGPVTVSGPVSVELVHLEPNAVEDKKLPMGYFVIVASVE
jgi:hypothetical protein